MQGAHVHFYVHLQLSLSHFNVPQYAQPRKIRDFALSRKSHFLLYQESHRLGSLGKVTDFVKGSHPLYLINVKLSSYYKVQWLLAKVSQWEQKMCNIHPPLTHKSAFLLSCMYTCMHLLCALHIVQTIHIQDVCKIV